MNSRITSGALALLFQRFRHKKIAFYLDERVKGEFTLVVFEENNTVPYKVPREMYHSASIVTATLEVIRINSAHLHLTMEQSVAIIASAQRH